MIGWYKLFGTSSLVAVPPGGGKGDPALPVLPPVTNPTPPPPQDSQDKHWPHSPFRLTHHFHISIAFLVHHSTLRIPRAGTNGSKKDFGHLSPANGGSRLAEFIFTKLFIFTDQYILQHWPWLSLWMRHIVQNLINAINYWPRPLSLSQGGTMGVPLMF